MPKNKNKVNHFKNTKKKYQESTGGNNKLGESMGKAKVKATSPGVPNRGKDTIKIQARNLGQKQILQSLATNTITIVDASAGVGKAQPLESIVYTPSGPVPMGVLKIGQQVCTPDGGVAKILQVHPQGVKSVYKVIFSDGSQVQCCKQHLWEVEDRRLQNSSIPKQKRKYVSDTFSIGDYVSFSKRGRNTFYISTSQPAYFKQKQTFIPPYLMGVVLGDGCLTMNKVDITSADPQIFEKIKIKQNYQIKKTPSHQFSYCLVRNDRNKNGFAAPLKNQYTQEFQNLGLMGTDCFSKFIPQIYKINSSETRTQVLRGLLDTDGSLGQNGSIQYTTASKQLSQDVKFIVESLGGIDIVSTRYPKYSYKGELKIGALSYRHHIRFNDPSNFFHIKRKKEKFLNKKEKYLSKRRIQAVSYVGEKQCQCISIDSKQHLYLTNNFIKTHNSHIAVLYGLNQLLKGTYQKFIVARPCVQTYGQNLGFLPGTAQDKVMVYFEHLFDILSKHIDIGLIKSAIANKRIQIVPFAYMRGRNFENSFVFCDQVQNTIPQQFRLIITRLSQGSKMILCGDSKQSDRCDQLGNGLADAMRKFKNVDNIGVLHLGSQYIVRSSMVKTIQQIYDADASKRKGNNEPDSQIISEMPENFQKLEDHIGTDRIRDQMPDGSVPSRQTLWT